jgi:hypothetical protein
MDSQIDEKNYELSTVYWIPNTTSIYIEKGILWGLLLVQQNNCSLVASVKCGY